MSPHHVLPLNVSLVLEVISLRTPPAFTFPKYPGLSATSHLVSEEDWAYETNSIIRKENVAVVALAAYVAFGFVFMEIFYFAVWCRPFHNYWAVPTPNIQCSAAIHHLITNAVFNISSDLLTLALALQMFIRSKLPLKRKLVLCGIFGLGIFVIFAAVLNKYYSFNEPFGSLWTFWYVRESSTAMIVANLPFLWTLLRRVFKLGSFENPSLQPSLVGSQGERHGWLQRLRAQGRRFSSHVLHGVDISLIRSATSGNSPRLKSKNSYNSSRLCSNSHRPDSEEQTSPQRLVSQPDPEAQRHPWDEMDLGEFLTEPNNGQDCSNNASGADDMGSAPQRRRSWGGSQW